MRKLVRCTLTMMFATFALSAGPAKQEANEETVRVTETTVITVHGSAAPLPEETQIRKRGSGAKFRRGSSAVSRGAVRATGWLLNVSDDIPSARERAAMPPHR